MTTRDARQARRPSRRGTFVVRHRLRLGGLVSGALLVASLGLLALFVLSSPWIIVRAFREADGTGHALGGLVGVAFWVGLFGMIAILAGIRPGNAALRRRVLAMDDEGVWLYQSARWRSAPRFVPWREASPIRAATERLEDVDSGDSGPTPTLVPWDYLLFGDPWRGTIELLWLTATAEEIVEQARRRRPDLVFLDERTPPPRGLGGWVLRRRRNGRWNFYPFR